MVKISTYIKPFALSIIAVVVLLFTQAQCELALPDTMSDIVDIGIQSGGIENGVPEVIRETEANNLFAFMEEEEITLFEDSYTLVQPQQADSKLSSKVPAAAEEAVYVLNRDADRKALVQVVTIPEMTLMKIAGNRPEVIGQLQSMSTTELTELQQQLQVDPDMPIDHSVQAASARYVQNEYRLSGINTEKLQMNYIFRSGLRMLVIALFGTACALMVSFLAARIAAGHGQKLRHAIFSKVESFSVAEFNKFSPATLITRTTNDVQQIQTALVMTMRIVIYAPIIGVGALLRVLDSNVSMTWIIALIIVIIMGIMGIAFQVVLPKFSAIQKMIDKLNSVLREFLDGLPVIRAFNTEKTEEAKFDDINKQVTHTNLFVNRVMAVLMPLMMLVMNCCGILIVWVGAHQINMGQIQIGDMLAFIQYSMQIIMAFLMISMVSVMLPRAAVAMKRILEVLNCDVSIKDPEQPQHFDPEKKGEVEFEDVSFAYPEADENVLDHITFKAMPGQTTAFIGSTGSGKSTVVNLVPRFFDVTSGVIKVDGVDVRQVTQKELRDRIGYVPQKGTLFSGTIESNLRYGDDNADEEQIRRASHIAQASEFIESKPEKYETPISQGGTNVSGGQKQRLSIARALVKDPEILIFDDSFSALDFKTDAALRKELNEMCEKGKNTVLLVAQRISSIMHADQIIVLDSGRIAGKGTHEELMKNCDVYREIAYSQLSKEELENADEK